MGIDWKIYELVTLNGKPINPDCDDLVNEISQTPNFIDIWDEYGYDPDVINGHSGKVVLHYLNGIITKMIEDDVVVHEVETLERFRGDSENFWWGLDKYGKPLTQYRRKEIVLNGFRRMRTLAEKHYKAHWWGNESWEYKDYIMDGEVVKPQEFTPEY